MGEDYEPLEWDTQLSRGDVEGRELWLIQVPSSLDAAASLESLSMQLPEREQLEPGMRIKCKSAKEKKAVSFGVRVGDESEFRNFRLLVSEFGDTSGRLRVAPTLALQLTVTEDVPAEESSAAGVPAPIVEPYRGFPRKRNLRVRCLPPGCGAVERVLLGGVADDGITSSSTAGGTSTTAISRRQQQNKEEHPRGKKRQSASEEDPQQEEATASSSTKKKKKRKSRKPSMA
jgi:hypothetical protein